MSNSKDIKGIESIYGTIRESEDNKVWKSGDCPEALGDSEHAHDLKPEQPCSTADEDCVTGGKPVTPEHDESENALYMKKISERLKENREKHGKSVPSGINNSRIMSNEPNNIFDKLYSTIMEGDDPFADLNGMDSGLEGDDLGGDEELDLGDDEVTLNLPRDLAEQLCDALKEQLGEGGDESEGEDGLGLDDEDEMLGDSVVSKPDPAPAPDGVSKLTGNNNKTEGSGYSAEGGSAEGGNIKEDPTPKETGKGNFESGHHELAANKKNQVHNPKTKGLGD